MAERPEFTHKRERHGLIGPFSGRQLAAILVTVVVAIVVLVAATTPLGTIGAGPGPIDPRPTAYIIDEAPAVGLRPGDAAPELSVVLEDGTTYELTDLDGQPIRMADLRKSGKAVWINFFATWCPPCQSETPVMREVSEKYADRGLELIAISVQETSPEDVQAYADRYELDYTIGFDGAGRIFRSYKVYALPTQFFIDPMGVIRDVAQGPLTVEAASAYIERILPPAPELLGGGASASPSASPSPSPSPSPAP